MIDITTTLTMTTSLFPHLSTIEKLFIFFKKFTKKYRKEEERIKQICFHVIKQSSLGGERMYDYLIENPLATAYDMPSFLLDKRSVYSSLIIEDMIKKNFLSLYSRGGILIGLHTSGQYQVCIQPAFIIKYKDKIIK